MPIPDHFALPTSVAPRADQDAAFDRHRAGLVVFVWDRTSPINGVPADHFHGRDDVPAEGDIYLIGDGTGHTFIFQPHHPQGGPIGLGQGVQAGNAHADQLAAQRTHADLLPPVGRDTPNPALTDPAVAAVVRAANQTPVPTGAPHTPGGTA